MMLSEENAEHVIDGTKTVTRRQSAKIIEVRSESERVTQVRSKNTAIWKVGRTFTWTMGRGQGAWMWRPSENLLLPKDEATKLRRDFGDLSTFKEWANSEGYQPLRSRIISLKKDDNLLEMSLSEAHHEGFADAEGFWAWWVNQYGTKQQKYIINNTGSETWRSSLYLTPNRSIFSAWRIGFILVRTLI